ncbi:hypothetical protein MB02_05160 [Croceicoccus estronivorus]|nr:hypothetical protein MB02_05160 [Croceicoccus estronivorus]
MESHEQSEWNGTKAFLGGLYAAKLYIAAPVLLGLLIMAIFGEGDYILAILAGLYTALAVHGERVRRAAEIRTFRRSLGFNTALWSSILAALCAMGAIAFAASGGWRYFG